MRAFVDDVLRSLRASPILAFYVLATLVVATIIGLMTVNVIDLGMTHFGTVSHRTHDVTYGILFTTSVVGVLAQVRRPEKNVAAMVMALLPPAALLLAGLLAGDYDRVVRFNPFWRVAVVIVVVALVHPVGRGFFGSFRPSRVSVPMLALVGVAAVPLISSASTNLRLQRTVDDMHAVMGHYGFMAAFSFTVIAVGVLASLRPAGWRVPALAAGLAVPVLGVASLLYPDSTSSIDAVWALATIAWGATFLAVAMLTSDLASPAPLPVESTVPVDAERAMTPSTGGARAQTSDHGEHAE